MTGDSVKAVQTCAARNVRIDAFLEAAGWGRVRRDWLKQDASTRRYARLTDASGNRAILMDAPRIEPPPCQPDMNIETRQTLGWNAMARLAGSRVEAFVLIANHLRAQGLKSPQIYAHNSAEGLALIEDFGEGREFARLIERGAADEIALYEAAARTLAKLHNASYPPKLEDCQTGESWPLLEFDAFALRANVDVYNDWFFRFDARIASEPKHQVLWEKARDVLIARAMAFPRAFTLRDYHGENLLWLDPPGAVGLLDFQDAIIGWDAWDIAMLIQDSRRKVSGAASEAVIRAYCDASGCEESAFRERLAVIGTLNALRILGVFARLIIRDNKTRYKNFIPRQADILARNLRHPSLADMRAFFTETAPFILSGAAP